MTRLYFLKQNTLYFKPTFIHVQDINSDVSESLAATNLSFCKLVRKSKYLVTLYYLQIILKSWSQKITVAATKQCTSSNSQNKVTAKLKKKLVYSKQILGSPEHTVVSLFYLQVLSASITHFCVIKQQEFKISKCQTFIIIA